MRARAAAADIGSDLRANKPLIIDGVGGAFGGVGGREGGGGESGKDGGRGRDGGSAGKRGARSTLTIIGSRRSMTGVQPLDSMHS